MRDFLKKAFALTLGASGLGFLMAHATLTNGCRPGARGEAVQAPAPESSPARTSPVAAGDPSSSRAEGQASATPTASASSAANTLTDSLPKRRRYMGATKAPPMEVFQEEGAVDASPPAEQAPRTPANTNQQAK
jgi:hypothetical protein